MYKIKQIIILITGINLSLINPCLAQFRPDRPTFFQDGQRFMEQEIKRLEAQQKNIEINQQNIEHPSQLLTINDGKLSWQKYIFQDGGFSVWMPSGLNSEETVNLETSAGEIPFEVFATHPKSLRFIAAYSNSPNITKIGNSEAILTAVKDGIIQRTNFQLLTDQEIEFSAYPGKYLVMQDPTNNEVIYFNLYVINNKVYVIAAGTKTSGYEQDIRSFLDSFRLL
jgi:hypothetical protein